MKDLRKIAEETILDILQGEPSKLEDDIFYFNISEEIEIEDGTFLLIEGEAEQKIKKIYPQTYEDEGCIDCYEPTGEFTCELFNEDGVINTFNIEL